MFLADQRFNFTDFGPDWEWKVLCMHARTAWDDYLISFAYVHNAKMGRKMLRPPFPGYC